MIPRGLIRTINGWLGKPIADPSSDPQRFFGALYALPNPDPILREMGEAERVYASILADAHVLGDVRSIRGNFRGHVYRLVAGDEGDSKSLAAQELCERWMASGRPNAMCDWLEVMWQMASAAFYGYRVHEPVWAFRDGAYLPGEVWDRPGRRVRFDAWGAPMLVSRANALGAPLEEPWQLVISRHMPTADNPYGVAVLSSCFWPWTFKTGGWRYFVKFCERHGLPWPIGRYPLMTPPEDQAKLAEALQSMIEAAYAVVPEGTGVELLETKATGTTLPQAALIDLCNTEMSKALTGQAMVAELRGTGARAASETALKRQEAIDDSVRDIAAQTMGDLFRWITLLNFGDGVAPPTIEFYEPKAAGLDRAKAYDMVRSMGGNPSRSALMDELRIPQARDADDVLQPPALPSQGTTPNGQAAAQQDAAAADDGSAPGSFAARQQALLSLPGMSFARAAGISDDEALQLASDAADQAIEAGLIAPIAEMLATFEAEGRTLAEFADALADLVGRMDDADLRHVVELSLQHAALTGLVTEAP